MMLTDLADAARTSGLLVVERLGWRTRGHGEMSGVHGIVCHHTAGPAVGDTPSLNVVQEGRRGLAGPLAQLYLSRSGDVYVVAAGLCWHAGVVFIPATQSNAWAIGIEAEATGNAAWPDPQYNAYARLCRALVDHYRIPLSSVFGHKEVAKPLGRKPDPNFDMGQFRAAIASLRRPEIEDVFMALTDAEQHELLDGMRKLKPGAVFPARSPNCRTPEDDQYGHVMSGEAEAADALAEVRGLRRELAVAMARITPSLGELSDGTLALIARAVNDEAARREAK